MRKNITNRRIKPMLAAPIHIAAEEPAALVTPPAAEAAPPSSGGCKGGSRKIDDELVESINESIE
tara:strand:- start:385 stop:579 length:195 start_codon:yes stop_codon:yes gene_type:complete